MLRAVLYRRSCASTCQASRRRGSALLVVIVLLTMLASLGVIFYMFAAQERSASTYYSKGAEVRTADLPVEDLMDEVLEQLIVGPRPDVANPLKNSVLYGRAHSLMGNLLGLESTSGGQKFDFAPYNGTPFDSSQPNAWQINDSPVAHDGQDPVYSGPMVPNQRFPLSHRDPDYTYPDLNNVFLSYDGYDPVKGHRIIIPSFHRPQSPNLRGVTAWYGRTSYAQSPNPVGNAGYPLKLSLLRPCLDHQYIPPGSSPAPGNDGLRYLDDATAQSIWGPQAMGFPFIPPRNPNLGTYPPGTRTLPLGQQGVWSLTSTSPPGYPITGEHYEYDVDNDGDGVWEGVWLDLGLPLRETADGEQYVPLVSFTVKDADALLNLNVHGNLASVWASDTQLLSPFVVGNNTANAGTLISKSNLGLTPSEVNLLWGLNRRPQTLAHISSGSSAHEGDYDQSAADSFFLSSITPPTPPAKPVSWYETANRDFLYLVMGRYTPSPLDLVPGRWGEGDLLYQAITNNSPRNPLFYAYGLSGLLAQPWPGPGQTRLDDNGDVQYSTGGFYGSAFTPFGQPLDYTGLGQYVNLVGAGPVKGKTLFNPGANGKAQWPRFTRYSNASANGVSWPALTNSIVDVALFNDPAEVVVETDYLRPEDNFFGPEEMRALHFSSTDFTNYAGGSSRLTKLAPFNFEASAAAFPQSGRSTQEFRAKFTTRSWDRKQFSLRYDPLRPWEYSADADGDGRGEFPPYLGQQPYSQLDPFRPLLRRLLEVEYENTNQPRYGLRLNLNGLLVGPNGNPYPTFAMPPTDTLPPDLELHYRPLTPHPNPASLPLTGSIPDFGWASYPPQGNFGMNYQLQEYWARVDRQLLARDIFMLLFVSVWPDAINYTGQPAYGGIPLDLTNASVQSALREMAQYAVNVVDALDRDNIITRFAYDKDPTNGWNISDYPYGDLSNPQREEVWGVERLDLTLSEALAVQTEPHSSDLPFTAWDENGNGTDNDGRYFFAYVELRNPGPHDVDLSQRAWRIEVGPDYATAPATDHHLIRRLELRQGTIAAGSRFTIGSVNHALPGMYPSIMKIDHTNSGNTNWDTDQTLWLAPNQHPLNLDLKDSSQVSQFVLTDANGGTPPSGSLYGYTGNTSDGSDSLDVLYFRLYRRVNPHWQTTNEDENPWVLVDEIALDDMTQTTTTSGSHAGRLAPLAGLTAADIGAHLRCLQSRERAQPFSGRSNNGYAYNTQTVAGSPPYANTLGQDNAYSPPYFRDWQRVFDRDFASPGELLQLSLGGFYRIDQGQGRDKKPLPGYITKLDTDQYWGVESDALPGNSAATLNGTAEMLFLPFSTGPDVSASAPIPRWHRFLEFVEVPTRMHVGIAGLVDPVDNPRVPGKMNLNMLRHPEALAALIDDPSIMQLLVDEDANFNAFLDLGEDLDNDGTLDVFNPPWLFRTDLTSGAVQPTAENLYSWWQGFLAARDGLCSPTGLIQSDPTTGLFLPGLPGSNPFRSYAAANGTFPAGQTTIVGSVEKSLLRSWPTDTTRVAPDPLPIPSPNPRQLFEIGTWDEHRGVDAAGNPWTNWMDPKIPDPYAARRILNKIMNNSTNRSHVFVVFVSIKYFRARINPTTGAVQIGGPLKPFDDPSGLASSPPVPPDRTDSGWQPEHRGFFVIDRSQLEKAYDRGTGQIDWRPLVEYRQIFY